jgi:hypothetical protein
MSWKKILNHRGLEGFAESVEKSLWPTWWHFKSAERAISSHALAILLPASHSPEISLQPKISHHFVVRFFLSRFMILRASGKSK